MIPGEYILAEPDIVANEGRETVELTVVNTGDRPIQVGSHFHIYEVNKALSCDRRLAFGKRLNIPAGTAVRFEPGDDKKIKLVRLGGPAKVLGLNALTTGATDASATEAAVERADARGFANVKS